MLNELKSQLQTVHTRQRFDRALRFASIGFLSGAVLGSSLLIAQLLGLNVSTAMIWSPLAVFSVLFGLVGLAWSNQWHSSARLVDSACQLKDRTLTALEFAQQGLNDQIHQLQQKDALTHLQGVTADDVLPWKAPRFAQFGAFAFSIMVVLSVLPTRPTAVSAATTEPLEAVQQVSTLLEETMLDEIKKLAEEQKDPELEKLMKELEELVEEMKAPEVDQKEALAKLSEMQQLVAEAVTSLDVAALEAQLQELAEAINPAEPMQAASQSMKNGDYTQAAAELEKVEPKDITKRERDAMSSNLAKLASKSNGKQGKLSDALAEMVEGLENENDSKTKEGLCKAAGVCKSQGLKKSIKECLNCQLNRLSECKGSCQGNGLCMSNNVAKSENPSNKAGMGASGNPFGENKTKLDSTRRQEDITGVMGEGASERETESTLEAKQKAGRDYQERYNEYKKQMEEVLDSEPLPLGHRATVRRYFEAIRPNTTEDAVIAPPTAPEAQPTTTP